MIEERAGFVYVLSCHAYVKIGHARTDDPASRYVLQTRISTLQIGCPYPLDLLAYAWVDDAASFEHWLHRRLHSHHLAQPHTQRGEWFSLSSRTAMLFLLSRLAREAQRSEAIQRPEKPHRMTVDEVLASFEPAQRVTKATWTRPAAISTQRGPILSRMARELTTTSAGRKVWRQVR